MKQEAPLLVAGREVTTLYRVPKSDMFNRLHQLNVPIG